MSDATSIKRTGTLRLILVPSVITLAVTLLRLVGELQHWPSALFNPSAGGPGSIVGITWLAMVFGIYFAIKLSGQGEGPATIKRAIVHAVIGLAIVVGGSLIAGALRENFHGFLVVTNAALAIAALIQYPAWPALFKTLVAYAYAARIPVAILMYFAMRGNWGTHYDAVPPNAPEAMNQLGPKYFWLALLPQLIAWVGFTVVSGALFGSVTVAIARRRKPAAQAAAKA